MTTKPPSRANELADMHDREDPYEMACAKELRRQDVEIRLLRAENEALKAKMETITSEIEALPIRSTGYPPYQHSPDWIKQQAADIVQRQLGGEV